MDNFQFNKIFAAILIAGITAMLGGFVANLVMHPHELEKDAVSIEGGAVVAVAGGGPALPDPIMGLIATADVAKGEKISKACAACHSFNAGGPTKVGPNLHAVVGKAIGKDGGFEYSSAMAEFGGNWDYEALNKFLLKPKNYMPGTKMNYIGLKKPEDRAAIVAWLKTQGSSGYPLPSEAQIAAEEAELAPPEPEDADADKAEDKGDIAGEEDAQNDESSDAKSTDAENEDSKDDEKAE